jgi:hypothetical protein
VIRLPGHLPLPQMSALRCYVPAVVTAGREVGSPGDVPMMEPQLVVFQLLTRKNGSAIMGTTATRQHV